MTIRYGFPNDTHAFPEVLCKIVEPLYRIWMKRDFHGSGISTKLGPNRRLADLGTECFHNVSIQESRLRRQRDKDTAALRQLHANRACERDWSLTKAVWQYIAVINKGRHDTEAASSGSGIGRRKGMPKCGSCLSSGNHEWKMCGRLASAAMSIRIVRLGTPRGAGEGLRLGTVRRPPRGVPKAEFARLDYYDVWFPNLSPSAELVQEALHAADERAWAAFRRKFRREMSAPDRSRELDLLAAISHLTNFSLGCYCEDERRCHRSLLRELLVERGAEVV